MTEATGVTVDYANLVEQVLEALAEGNEAGVRALLAERHPAEITEVIERLPVEELQEAVFRLLDDETAGEVLDRLSDSAREHIVEDLTAARLADVVQEMPPDEAADLVGELPEERRSEVLEELPAEDRVVLRNLMVYGPETAGGLMTPRVTALRPETTADQAIRILRDLATSENETIYYVYVTDERGVLIGVVSLRQLLMAPSEKRIAEIMNTNVQKVRADEDQEEVARKFQQYDFIALPVVDEEDRLIGVITVDDILHVMSEEQSEDVQVMVGAGADERIDSPPTLSLKRRLPWLYINLGTAFGAATVVSFFEDTIRQFPVLAVLMPVVAGVAGNTGQQALAVVIRSVVQSEAASRNVGRVLKREMLLGLVHGLCVGLGAAVVAYVFIAERRYAVAIAAALLLAMTLASVIGAAIPLLLRRMGLDPAQGSSVLLTAITDMSGFAIFLGIAKVVFLQIGIG